MRVVERMNIGPTQTFRETEITLLIELLAFDDDYPVLVQIVDNFSNRTGVGDLAEVQTFDFYPKGRVFNGFELEHVFSQCGRSPRMVIRCINRCPEKFDVAQCMVQRLSHIARSCARQR